MNGELEMECPKHPGQRPADCPCAPPPERTYTESELRQERAAWLREAVAIADKVKQGLGAGGHGAGMYMEIQVGGPICDAVHDALLEIPTDQSALDRRDAVELKVVSNAVIESLQEEISKMREAISPGRQNVGCDYYCAVARRLREKDTQIHLKDSNEVRSFANKIHWLSQTHGVERIDELVAEHDAEFKAQTAATLEALADKWKSYDPHPNTPISETRHRCAKELLAAIPADQSALDRHDAELRAKWAAKQEQLHNLMVGADAHAFAETFFHGHIDFVGNQQPKMEIAQFINALEQSVEMFVAKRDAELKAQTAAILEKAACLTYEAYSRGTGQVKFAATEASNNIRALIAADHAAALAERDKEQFCNGVRSSVEEIAKVIPQCKIGVRVQDWADAYAAERVRQAVQEYDEVCALLIEHIERLLRQYPPDEAFVIRHNPQHDLHYAKHRLATHRAAAGAPEETK